MNKAFKLYFVCIMVYKYVHDLLVVSCVDRSNKKKKIYIADILNSNFLQNFKSNLLSNFVSLNCQDVN